MRKWMIAFIVLILILVSVYWLIPTKVNIHQKVMVPVNTKAFARGISNEQTWRQWWPGKQTQSTTIFEYNGCIYSIDEKKLTSLVITISKGKDSILTELIFVPVQNDTIELTWNGINSSNENAVSHTKNYSWTKTVKSDLDFLLKKMQSFYSNEDNVYGFHIEKAIVPDSNYISTSAVTAAYPQTQIIYGLIDKLKNYIHSRQAKETGYPMLNIYRNADSTYLVRVAIPTDKKLDNSGNIQYRWMLKAGNILVTEVKGGPHKIEKAFTEVGNYVEDHQRIAPAIPFQSLITDRRQEPDTSKWVTKVYWPVM